MFYFYINIYYMNQGQNFLNQIKLKEIEEKKIRKNMESKLISQYNLNSQGKKFNSISKLSNIAKGVFSKNKTAVSKTTIPLTYKEDQVSNNTSNTDQVSNNTLSTELDNNDPFKNNDLYENNELLYKYSEKNKNLLKKMRKNMKEMINQNLYLNKKIKNENKQKNLEALQNYVKTQRAILKKINNNIIERNKIKRKYPSLTGKLFMKKENKEKLNRLLSRKDKDIFELQINNAVKKIKKIVNNNSRTKFQTMLAEQSKKNGITKENRYKQIKESRPEIVSKTTRIGNLFSRVYGKK